MLNWLTSLQSQVVDLLRQLPDHCKKKQVVLGRPVCQQAFKKLLGIGANRYDRSKVAARNNASAPLDGRMIKKPLLCKNKSSVKKRQHVVEYLEELYHTVSEPMPEANQSRAAASKVSAVNRRCPVLKDKPGCEKPSKPALFRRNRGRRPSQVVKLNRGKPQTAMRLLPPGSYSDYLLMFHTKFPEQKVSLKLFVNASWHCPLDLFSMLRPSFHSVSGWSCFDPGGSEFVTVRLFWAEVWAHSFGARLAIREPSQHAQCGLCVRHKVLIRKLSADQAARKLQLQLFESHLNKQYQDRTVYWGARATARLLMQPSGDNTLCIITDGIDHNKFRYPRSKVFCSKEFSGYVRPTMDMTACICHGRYLLLALSEPWVPKDSSWCNELLLHTLHRVGTQCDLRTSEVIIQSDNCSREVKNNTTTRMVGLLVGLHRIKRCELRFLMTGHSHEDVDAFFSNVANLIESHQELHTPDSFIRLLQTWLADKSIRPHEHVREVTRVDHVRDWPLRCKLCPWNILGSTTNSDFEWSSFRLIWSTLSIIKFALLSQLIHCKVPVRIVAG